MIEYTNGSIKLTPTVFLEPGLLGHELCAQGGVVSPVTKKQMQRGIDLVAVGTASLLKAQAHITGCKACDGSASRSFQSVLAEVLEGCHATKYFVCAPIECPRCASPILETTFVSMRAERRGPATRIYEPPLMQTDVVFVDEPQLKEAAQFISGCEHCAPDTAEITFDYLLDEITGCDPTVTEYVICHSARCPRCHREIVEKTLIVAD